VGVTKVLFNRQEMTTKHILIIVIPTIIIRGPLGILCAELSHAGTGSNRQYEKHF